MIETCPKISIIVTCYNEGEELFRAIRSLKQQTFQDFEVIVVKDYSNHQPTIDACNELERQGYKVLYETNNVGVSVTRNHGVEMAQGEIIYTFDGDDELPVEALAIIADTFAQYPEADVMFGNYVLIENGEEKEIDCSVLCDETGYLDIAKWMRNIILYGQSPMRRSAWDKVNGCSVEYSFGCQDFEMQLRMLEAGLRFIYVPNVIYRWYKKPSGINSSLRNALSFDKCCYEHLNYIEPYFSPQRVLQLCQSTKDYIGYRNYFHKYATGWLRRCSWLPYILLKRLARFIK